MAKGTAIDRVLHFYRTASADTVRVVHQLAHEVMDERGIGRNGTRVKDKLHRKGNRGGKAHDGDVGAEGGGESGGGKWLRNWN